MVPLPSSLRTRCVLSVCATLFWAFAACAPPEEPADAPPPLDPSLVDGTLLASVETVRIEPGDFREVLELVGETAPVRSASVTAEIPGRILRLDAHEGDRVAQGDTLLRIDTSTQSAQIDQLRAQRRQAVTELERARALQTRGLGTQAQIDQYEAQIDILDESINQVRVGTRQATVRAPISGVVTRRSAEPGEYASPGVPLLRIADLSTVVVHVGLPEREIGAVREGMEVEVRILATGRTHRGTLHRIGAEANPANRTFPLEVRLDNETGDLRGGMRATVLVQKSSLPSALIVPRDAILQNLDGREVFLVRDGLAVRRDVRTGPGRLGWVVVHEGLAAGDELVVRGQRSLVHGERVSAIQLGACCNDQLATASGTGALPDPAPPARDEDPGTPLADER